MTSPQHARLLGEVVDRHLARAEAGDAHAAARGARRDLARGVGELAQRCLRDDVISVAMTSLHPHLAQRRRGVGGREARCDLAARLAVALEVLGEPASRPATRQGWQRRRDELRERAEARLDEALPEEDGGGGGDGGAQAREGYRRCPATYSNGIFPRFSTTAVLDLIERLGFRGSGLRHGLRACCIRCMT